MGRKLSNSKKSFTFAAVYIQIGNDNIETKNDKMKKGEWRQDLSQQHTLATSSSLTFLKNNNELDNISLIKFFIKNEKTIN